MSVAALAAEWAATARACQQTERIAQAEALRLEGRGRGPSLPSLRLRQRAAAHGVRGWVLEMASMLVLGPRLELVLAAATGVGLVCTHDAVEGESCRCALARSVAEGCLADARRRGLVQRPDERRIACMPDGAA